MAQEVITPELAKKIQEYEKLVDNWQALRTQQSRGAVYAALLAVPLWVASYLASAATGPVNQGQWFTAFTFFAFVGALATSFAAVVLSGFVLTTLRPRRDFKIETTVAQMPGGAGGTSGFGGSAGVGHGFPRAG